MLAGANWSDCGRTASRYADDRAVSGGVCGECSACGVGGGDGAGAAPAGKKRAAGEARGVVNVGFTHDFAQRAGHISVDGHLDRVEDAIRVAQAFGRTLNHGWELTGGGDGVFALGLEWRDAAALEWACRCFER